MASAFIEALRVIPSQFSSLWLASLYKNYLAANQPPPHGFTSHIFVNKLVTQPVPVAHFFQLFPSWRSTALLKALLSLFTYGLAVAILFSQWEFTLIVSITLSVASSVLIKTGKIKQGISIGSVVTALFEPLFACLLVIISKLAGITRIRSLWNFFWSTYFLLSPSPHGFSQDYLEAWRLAYPTHIITIFVDQAECVHIPCPDPHDVDDLWLLKHLSLFYRMTCIHGGIFRAILPKSLAQVDIVELEQKYGGDNAGQCCSTMDLGIRIPEQIENSNFKSIPDDQKDYIHSLVANHVFRQVSPTNAPVGADAPKALNFVTKWDPFWLSVIVLSPTVVSIAINVAWPVVAVSKYGADVQDSIQTATSLASYIVTTGALLIGLVTLFDALAK